MTLLPRPSIAPQRLAWTALACRLTAMLVGFFVDRLNPAVGLWFTEIFCLLGVAWALTRWSGRAPGAYVRLRWPGIPAVVFASALSVANFFGLAGPINAVSEHFAPENLKTLFDASQGMDRLSSIDLWLFAAAAIFAAAFCEEFLFRGVVQNGLSESGAHPAEAIFRTALVFALFHFNPVSLLALLELGLLFGFLYHRTGSLIPGMVAHATQNATALGLYLWDRSHHVPESSAEASVTQVIGMAGMGIIVLVMLYQLGKHFPSVWGHPKTAPFERPRLSLTRAFAPWLVGACLFMLGWYAVDRRGLELGAADLQVELPLPGPDESADKHEARLQLDNLRQKVRSGNAPMHSYLESRRALSQSLSTPADSK